jgi:hypothetical protein
MDKYVEAIIELALIVANQRKSIEAQNEIIRNLKDYKDSKEIPF